MVVRTCWYVIPFAAHRLKGTVHQIYIYIIWLPPSSLVRTESVCFFYLLKALKGKFTKYPFFVIWLPPTSIDRTGSICFLEPLFQGYDHYYARKVEKHFSAFCLSIKVGIKSEMIQILTMNVSETYISIDGYFVNALFKGETCQYRFSVYL